MMSPTRLVAWLKQVPKDADTFSVVLLPTGDEEEETVQTWPAYDPNELPHDDFATMVLEEVQVNCDDRERVCSFAVRATAKGNTLTSRNIRAVPNPPEIGEGDVLRINQSVVGGNNAMQQLVRMNEAMLRMLVSSFGSIQKGYNDLLSEQRKQIERMSVRENELANNILIQVAKQADIPESEIRNAQALSKFADLAEKYVPQVIETYLTGDGFGEE